MRRAVAVIGGGIAGLTAALRLSEAAIGPITIFESSPRWGGKLRSLEIDGVRLDAGAESLLARRREAIELVDQLGLGGLSVHPTAERAGVLIDGEAHGLPASAMGVPTDLDALEGYLSPEGLARARQEPQLVAPALAGDVGIGSYLDQRFGSEVTDRLLEPLLGGVHAGRSRDLSFAAVAPALYARARAGGSLLEHARALSPTTVNPTPVFAGLVGGVNGLVPALLAELERRGVELRVRTTVRELDSVAGQGFRLTCGPVPWPETVEAEAVVIATPATAGGRLLSGVLGDGAADYGRIPYASMAVVSLVLKGNRPPGSGLLVPPGQSPTIKALTYSSNKWEWVAAQAAEAWGAGAAVVRASVGRQGEAGLLQVHDEALIQRTWTELAGLPGWSGAELLRAEVTRWGGGLPQYLVGHTLLVEHLHTQLGAVPGLAVCGAALNGVGIPACLASAEAAATKIKSDFTITTKN